LGWGKASHASHRGEREPGFERELVSSTRPLTRGNSTPWSPDCLAHAGMDGGKSTDRREHEWEAQATHRAQDGYRRSAGRACGSIRWQKSTDDARPRAPRREERPEAAGSSSTSPHRVRKSERASEAGPRSAKPLGSVTGSRPRPGAQASGRVNIPRWKAHGALQHPCSLTGTRARSHQRRTGTSLLGCVVGAVEKAPEEVGLSQRAEENTARLGARTEGPSIRVP